MKRKYRKKLCTICQKIYIPNTGSQKYCIKCVKNYWADYRRDFMRRFRKAKKQIEN